MPKDKYYLPQRTLVSQNESAMTEAAHVQRSQYKNKWSRITSFNSAYLVPIMYDELMPGDHVTYEITPYVRMATPKYPLFSNQTVHVFGFFTPFRLVWQNFVKLMGEQLNPASSISYIVPYVESPVLGWDVGSIYDHMGVPPVGQIADTFKAKVSALPFRADNLIFNTWFRDQNLENSQAVDTSDGPDTESSYFLKQRAKAHDRFTDCLPWPQKFTAPIVPIQGQAPISGIGTFNRNFPTAGQQVWEVTSAPTYAFAKKIDPAAADTEVYIKGGAATNSNPLIYAELGDAGSTAGILINQIRNAFAIQTLLERDARGGTRYVELIWEHFRIRNPDFRLARPEYIGGGHAPLNITPIAQTAPTDDVPVGALGAAATSFGGHRLSYAATEHGCVIAYINVRSEIAYQQQLHRFLWPSRTRYDFPWPELAGLGEQPVYTKELYYTGDPAIDDDIFGYEERYHQYRTRANEITGLMRSTAFGTIDVWHLAQEFASQPILNSEFIKDTPPMDRVLSAGALADQQQYIADIVFNRTIARPLPLYGTPVSLGRF